VADASPTNDNGTQASVRFGAWQPLTGRGIASFARSGFARVLGFQCVMALCVAAIVILALRITLFPAVDAALARLPTKAGIRNGRLDWPGTESVRLAENAWFDFVVTPAGTEPLGQTADLQFDLRPDRIRFDGALGHLDLPWPREVEFDLGRIPATASWGAWRGAGQALVAGGTFLWLMAVWWVLAALLAVPGALASLVLGRSISLGGLWRMAGAALVTGAAVAAVGIAGYATRRWQLSGLIAVQAIHFVVSPVWFAWGILATPRGGGKRATEPDAPKPKRAPSGKKRRGRNPFSD
jgi:hypothetical protein